MPAVGTDDVVMERSAAVDVAGAVERARRGDGEAFAVIYDALAPALHRYAYRLLGSAAAADDALQEAFVRAWQRLGELRDDRRLEPWLYRIVSSQCFDVLRRRRIVQWLPFEWPQHDRASTVDVERQVVEQDAVAAALRRLAPGVAAALVLYHGQGFDAVAVGEILGCSTTAVWQRLSRGRTALARALEEEDGRTNA